MFTGLIEEVGKIIHVTMTGDTMQLGVQCSKILSGLKIGDSIAVNGVCLTATKIDHDRFWADAMPETIQKTNFKQLRVSSPVNLERAMSIGDRFGGHIVQGHVDGTAILTQKKHAENAIVFHFEVPKQLTHWMIDKGSITINGVSLTLIEVGDTHCAVSLIPHTLTHTQINDIRLGESVNIECDLVGKYIAKWNQKGIFNPKQMETIS